MSDNREQAEQELVSAGMASGMEDSLASSLEGAFNPPPPPPREKESASVMEAIASSAAEQPGGIDPTETPSAESVPGLNEWPELLKSYTTEWQAESAVAREKAEKTRKKFEDEAAEREKQGKERAKQEKREKERKEKEVRDRERLVRELEGGIKEGKRKGGKGEKHGDREKKVKEAWEMVKASGSGSGKEDSEGSAADVRGVMPQDVEGGQALSTGSSRPDVKSTGYDPTTSTEPLPPSMQSHDTPPSPSYPHHPSGSTAEATSQAWTEVSASPSSAEDLSPPARSGSNLSGEDMMSVPRGSSSPPPTNKKGASSAGPAAGPSSSSQPQSGQGHDQPPAQPPSLTLSLFTMPSHLSVSRVVAVLGINLLLPFINGVMLGFGEIFAREVVGVGKGWWREGKGIFFWRNGGGRRGGVGNVGLSGSGGF